MTHEFDFQRLELAREARAIAGAWLADSDDARSTRVVVDRSVPTDVRELLEWREYRAQPDRRCGQVELSARERARLDFSETNVFHARSCKAIALEFEVSDWISLYDVTLTVDEHYDVYESSRSDVPERVVPNYMRGRA